jgi:thiosulfate dehydrogenase [quinone] large subunit
METGKFTRLQMGALVLLRVFIGWHFLYEGMAKLMKTNWSAASFLMQARGPLRGFFHWMAGSPEVLRYVDLMNVWGLILIGLGLILGAFTRTASFSGLLLILMYYFCNPPFVGDFYSLPSEGSYLIINKNLVEAAALLVTFAFCSGRFYGIDRIINKYLAGRRSAADALAGAATAASDGRPQ